MKSTPFEFVFVRRHHFGNGRLRARGAQQALAPVTIANQPTIHIQLPSSNTSGRVPLQETAPAQPARFEPRTGVVFAPASGTQLAKLRILVRDRQVFNDTCNTTNNCPYASTGGEYLVDLNPLGAGHNDQVYLSAFTSADIRGDAFIRVQRPWSFTGFNAPVLFRVIGDGAGFKLENLAPSIAAGAARCR